MYPKPYVGLSSLPPVSTVTQPSATTRRKHHHRGALLESEPSGSYMGVSQGLGFRYLFGGPYNKDYSILGSILGSPSFGKLPHTIAYYGQPEYSYIYISDHMIICFVVHFCYRSLPLGLIAFRLSTGLGWLGFQSYSHGLYIPALYPICYLVNPVILLTARLTVMGA